MKSKPFTNLLLVIVGLSFGCVVQGHAANDVVEVPFDFYHGSIIVHVRVDGKGPLNMLLDTGVDPSVVDLNTAKSIGLTVAAVGAQGSGGGSDVNLSYETKLPLVELGGLRAENVEALAVNLSKTSEALGRPLDGVLGYSLLKNRIVQIDYPRHVVRFYVKSPFAGTSRPPDDPKFVTLSFTYHDDILVDGVTVNGKRMVANLDTGSNANFQLTPAAVDQLGLKEKAEKAEVSKSVGFNGTSEHREGTIDNITLGTFSIDKPKVIFYGKGTGHDEQGWGIRIGNAFLKDCVVTNDYQSMRITLERP